jgi:AraC-like DNA-binding protein
VNLAAIALKDDFLGFHLAQLPDLRELGFLYYVSASSEILSDALQQGARYSSIVNEGVLLEYHDDRYVSIQFRYVGVSRHQDRQQIEFFMAVLVRLWRQLTGLRLVPARVRLTHRRDSELSEYVEFFGGNIEFGAAVDEVSFAPAVKKMPVVGADHYLNKLLVAYCEEALSRRPPNRGSLRSAVENAIVPLLPRGMARLNEVASRLGVSERTLARRLSAESLTFSKVVERLRIDLGRRYLADKDLSISQVAWLLGYQEVSSFTHSFKRWVGETPRQTRSRSLP